MYVPAVSVQLCQPCPGEIMIQNVFECAALQAHYRGPCLAQADPVPPACAVKDESGRNAYAFPVLEYMASGIAFRIRYKSRAVKVCSREPPAYLKFLAYRDAAFCPRYEQFRYAPGCPATDGRKGEDTAEIDAGAAPYEFGKLRLRVYGFPAVKISGLHVLIIEHRGKQTLVGSVAERVRSRHYPFPCTGLFGKIGNFGTAVVTDRLQI